MAKWQGKGDCSIHDEVLSRQSGEVFGVSRRPLRKLRDLFVGMEYFGSDPNSPAAFDEKNVAQSDLHVGLFGAEYGSIEHLRGKSFTHLEYEAARSNQIPCLIYFKQQPHSTKQTVATENAGKGFANLRTTLQQEHIVYWFENPEDLTHRFLIDFIKLLRTSLFEKAGALDQGTISVDAMRAVTTGLVPEQIQAIGQEKYIPEIYISRNAEAGIRDFVEFEKTLRSNVRILLEELDPVTKDYNLPRARGVIDQARLLFEDSRYFDRLPGMVNELKSAFFYAEIDADVKEIVAAIQQPTAAEFTARVRNLSRLRERSFIDSNELSNFVKGLVEVRARAVVNAKFDPDSKLFRIILSIFPSTRGPLEDGGGPKQRLANELLGELEQLTLLGQRRCVVLVDRAGTGKNKFIMSSDGATGEVVSSFPT